jgi:exodeoxyribonuclease V beta subunit
MSAPLPFDPANTPLETGVTLIEASAGTGKTHTIAALVLRLVIESGLDIREILAVTYTVAATEELRDRVRRRLCTALDDLRRGESADEIVTRVFKNKTVDETVRRLNSAVQNFDEAQIFTIHGFCQRVLRENAFESGALFDSELLADPSAILDEVAQDFWRRKFYEASPLLARLALAGGLSYGEWRKLLEKMRNHPGIEILPKAGNADSAAIARRLEKKIGEIIASWKQCGDEVETILAEDKNLSHAEKTFRRDKVDEIVRALSQLSENIATASPEAFAMLEKTSASFVSKATNKNKTPARHPFFDLCEEFRELQESWFNQLTHEFLAFARRETPLRKERLNVVTYDDLLTRLRDALGGSAGGALACSLREKYRAALIDEFQDTDPVQYEIFHKVFSDADHHLWFIGDPKQAIYGFRGADVFTYLRASVEAERKFTLGTNWRSEKPLIDAVNLLFVEKPARPSFKLAEIKYRAVSAPEIPRAGSSALMGKNLPMPLQFRFLKSDGDSFNQENAEEAISLAVVADIARLAASGAQLGARELAFGDMAVLVRSNAQAANLQQMLRERGIKSVLQSDESVFHTAQAGELLRLLHGVSEPGRDAHFKSALATNSVGGDLETLVAMDTDERARQEMQELFFELRDLWESSGFMAMFRRLLIAQNVRERLVQQPGGERSLTNFLHLAELVHGAETARHLAPDALCAWIRGQQDEQKNSVEENQLRLESDGDAVLISTIHKSKGLEYPVVFCPFLWKPADSKRRNAALFHNRADDEKKLMLDLGDNRPADHDAWASEELLAESLRVLYVAVTRAKNRCFVYAGDISRHAESPLGWLLGDVPPLDAIDALAKKSDGCIGVTTIDSEADALQKFTPMETGAMPELRAREFHGAIPRAQMIASFSSLTSGAEKEEPDRDAVPPPEASDDAEQPGAVLGDFERGVRAGLFLHDVMEHLDFQKPDALESLVAWKMKSHGIASSQLKPLCAKLRDVLAAPLAPGLSFDKIAWSDRLAEVEFSFPVVSLDAGKLRRVFSKHGARGLPEDFLAALERLDFRPVEGFMRGFIDLLFHFDGRYFLADWKSNWLGNRLADYDAEGIARGMAQHSYHLQYHLYTVAADLYLRSRVRGYDYEKNFGGVFYLFMRGVDPRSPGRGIFYDKPDAALVRDLRETFTGGAA